MELRGGSEAGRDTTVNFLYWAPAPAPHVPAVPHRQGSPKTSPRPLPIVPVLPSAEETLELGGTELELRTPLQELVVERIRKGWGGGLSPSPTAPSSARLPISPYGGEGHIDEVEPALQTAGDHRTPSSGGSHGRHQEHVLGEDGEGGKDRRPRGSKKGEGERTHPTHLPRSPPSGCEGSVPKTADDEAGGIQKGEL